MKLISNFQETADLLFVLFVALSYVSFFLVVFFVNL